jgi:holo-[acyl-carrier protein] synthase
MSTTTPTLWSRVDTWMASLLLAGGSGIPDEGCLEEPVARVGIDLVSVAEIAESVETFGDRYLRRVFTPGELASSRADRESPWSATSIESLAARFAAKEAVVKVLRPEGPRPEWADIEVVRHPGGWCDIRLSGRAASLADEAGIDQWAVSLTHHAALAGAVVLGIARSDPPRARRPEDATR